MDVGGPDPVPVGLGPDPDPVGLGPGSDPDPVASVTGPDPIGTGTCPDPEPVGSGSGSDPESGLVGPSPPVGEAPVVASPVVESPVVKSPVVESPVVLSPVCSVVCVVCLGVFVVVAITTEPFDNATFPFLTFMSKVKTPLSPSKETFVAAPLHFLSHLAFDFGLSFVPSATKEKVQVQVSLPTLTFSPLNTS